MNLASIRLCLLIVATVSVGPAAVAADFQNLPSRNSPTPPTTDGVPHVQLGVEPVPEISAELLRLVSEMPGIEIGKTIVSLPGAKGFWISEGITLARPDAIVRGREFAHVHPDGSLHASLPPELAVKAIEAGWAIHHPWSDQRSGWEGFVMIYTPGSRHELEVVVQLIVESFNFVVGKDPALSDQ